MSKSAETCSSMTLGSTWNRGLSDVWELEIYSTRESLRSSSKVICGRNGLVASSNNRSDHRDVSWDPIVGSVFGAGLQRQVSRLFEESCRPENRASVIFIIIIIYYHRRHYHYHYPDWIGSVED